MALANYSDLTTAVANWSGRADLTSRLPEFVSLAEADFNSELRTAGMEVVDQNFTIGGEYSPLPAGFLGVREFYLNTSPKVRMEYLPSGLETGVSASTSSTSTTRYYSIAGGNFRIAYPPGDGTSATLHYYRAVPGLQANTTNWLMTACPNLYLFNCLMQLCLYLKDTDGMQYWATAYKAQLDRLKDGDSKMKYGGTALRVRAA